MYDVAVVGAGPAGTSAALSVLRECPSARVVLLDRERFPRDKVCGDGIAPHALDVLADLGVDALAQDVPVSRLRLGFRDGPEVAGVLARPAHVVPRARFDARLVAAACARGVTLAQHRVRRVELRPDCVVLDGVIATHVVVAADGAHSDVRRALGIDPNPPGRVAVALRGYAPVSPGRATEQVLVFASRRWPAYAWSFPIGDGRANVGYGELLGDRRLSRAGLLERLEDLLPDAAREGTGWRAHHLPLSSGRPRQPDGRVLLAGDAASLINPVTGEGIYYAVLSGMLAGRAASAGEAAGRRYRTSLRRELGRHVRHTSAAAALSRSQALTRAAVRASGADAGVFAAMVELGLGRGLLTPRLLAGVAHGVAQGMAQGVAQGVASGVVPGRGRGGRVIRG